jgi:GNAT superfamily N-acetyltransferase
MSFCDSNRVVLLIARCLVTELQTVQSMEREGFSLMDTLVYYARDLEKHPIPQDTAQVKVRSVQPGEEYAVKAVATESFHGYFGHYHADARLDRAQCDAIYSDWSFRSCVSRDVADEVLVAELDGSVAGFATLRLNSPEEGEGVLFGIAPRAQRRGIYRSFMIQGMKWCLSKGATRMVVSTQITNIAVQKVWVRVGFEPSHAWYTFHKWFDRAGDVE